MIERYRNEQIAKIFSDQHKLELWQKTELAVMQAMIGLGIINRDDYSIIEEALRSNPINAEWWKTRDQEIHHDLNAFLDERLRFIPKQLQQYFHKNITSYDTEEPAFAYSLFEATKIIEPLLEALNKITVNMAIKYRYTIMNGRTHGQEAEMQSFGAKCLAWMVDLSSAQVTLDESLKALKYSKLSGAIGKYGSLDPEIEKKALTILGFEPFYGATQIMPRILYAPIAQSLCNLVCVINKIGLDIRLASRSGRPLLQEPFKKKQKGSSAMPHKKNTIRTEQLEGMARMAKGYMAMITDNIVTWEERAIEQSSVERVAWPDLFHVTAQSIKVLTGVLTGLNVYPDNMLKEIHESRGVYASSEVKEFLKTKLSYFGLGHEDAYRIVQIACFNVFEPTAAKLSIRKTIADSFAESERLLQKTAETPAEPIISIEKFITEAKLRVSDDLDINQEKVDLYNFALGELFSQENILEAWKVLFKPEFLLKNEDHLYKNTIMI